MAKYYIIYETKNLKDGKIYVGMHETDNLNDGYLGSGKRLKRAIRYYGKEFFERKILHIFFNKEDMVNKEVELVNEDLIKRPDTYNLKIGGEGGISTESHRKKFILAAKSNGKKSGLLHKERLLNNNQYNENFIEKQRTLFKKLHSEGKIKTWPKGKKHNELTIEKMRKSHIGKHSGSNNSQYGTCWITNGKDNKKVSKLELEDWISKGWNKGRI